MTRLFVRLEDSLLTYLQKRCAHPDNMVAADILEGGGHDVAVKYCRRCGAVKPVYTASKGVQSWRLPMPNLWRG
jgi:hypothetical protein